MPNKSTIKMYKSGETIIDLYPVEDEVKCYYAKGLSTQASNATRSNIAIVQTTGDSTTAVMSQKAVTDALDNANLINVATPQEVKEYLGI